MPALDLALAAALEVLLHLHLHADLVALVGVQRAPSQKDLKQKHRVSDLELERFQKYGLGESQQESVHLQEGKKSIQGREMSVSPHKTAGGKLPQEGLSRDKNHQAEDLF